MHNMTLLGWKNKLYFGDNLDILREHVASESVDLIYLDPPFNSAMCFTKHDLRGVTEKDKQALKDFGRRVRGER